MDKSTRTRLSQAASDRVRDMRGYLPQAMTEARGQLPPGILVRMSDGYSGLRYLSKVLFNTMDLEHVMYVPEPELYLLLVDGIVGAAMHRMKKQS